MNAISHQLTPAALALPSHRQHVNLTPSNSLSASKLTGTIKLLFTFTTSQLSVLLSILDLRVRAVFRT